MRRRPVSFAQSLGSRMAYRVHAARHAAQIWARDVGHSRHYMHSKPNERVQERRSVSFRGGASTSPMCCASVRFACGLPSAGLAVERLANVARTSCDGPFVASERIQWSWMAAAVTPRLATAGDPAAAPAALTAEVRVALGCCVSACLRPCLASVTTIKIRVSAACPLVGAFYFRCEKSGSPLGPRVGLLRAGAPSPGGRPQLPEHKPPSPFRRAGGAAEAD
jgi:hypothetical protein